MWVAETAFPRNWIWNRLADAKGDHAPRYLRQRFREALSWERKEQKRSPYARIVIRPRALIESLGPVSREAVEAIREEFPELGLLLDQLSRLGRTPLAAPDLRDLTRNVLGLGREVGLLGVYEETEGAIDRYMVPELYRLGLGLRRKGPA